MYWKLDKEGRDTDAGRLMSYISRGDKELKNKYGEEMTGKQQEDFIEKSAEIEHEKQLIISPKNADKLSDDELSLMTRKHMSEFLEDRHTSDYCFAIHRDTEHDHVQVALTGEKSDLYADYDERVNSRFRARDQFREREHEHEQALEQRREQQLEQEQQKEQEQDRSRGISK